MGKISGASSQMRFARTTPQWQNATRRVWNPASISWRDQATTSSHYYLMPAADVNLVFPNTSAGYQFCISFWVKPRAIGTGTRGLMQLEDASGNDLLSLTLNGLGVSMLFSGQNATSDSSLGSINLNTWNHVLFQMDTASWKITVNGTTNSGTTAAPPDFSLITQWKLGRGTNTSGEESFDGLMTDIMVAQAYPTTTQISVIYNGGATFNMAQNVIAPYNPLLANMTFLCDGTKTGVMLHLGVSRLTSSQISPQIQKQASFAWSGTLTNVPQLDSASRPAASGTTYSRLLALAQGWDNNLARTPFQGGSAIKPMPTGQSLSSDAPALLAWPYAGYSLKSDANSFVGAEDIPKATPQLTVSGTLTERGTSSNPMVGSGTLVHALEEREVRFWRPTFVRKV